MALKERAQWLDLPDRSGGAVCRAEARRASASMAAAASWSTQAVEQANVIGEHGLWGVLFTGILKHLYKDDSAKPTVSDPFPGQTGLELRCPRAPPGGNRPPSRH